MIGMHGVNTSGPDIRLLACFDALIAERSVSRAAVRLGMSQPTLSHALGRLRTLFDDPLLIKAQGRMIPTARALELQAEVQDVLARTERLVHRAGPFNPATARMEFTIMAAEYVEYLHGAQLVERLQRTAPGIDVQFHSPDREHALTLLERGEIDFRVGHWPKPPAQTLRFKTLFRDRIVCIVRASHPQIRGRVNLEQFLTMPHARIKTHRISIAMEALDHAVASKHGKLRVALQVHNEFALSQVVSRTDLIACIPERISRKLAEKFPLQVMPLPLTLPDSPLALYWHERTHHQPSHRWFREILADCLKSA